MTNRKVLFVSLDRDVRYASLPRFAQSPTLRSTKGTADMRGAHLQLPTSVASRRTRSQCSLRDSPVSQVNAPASGVGR